jgi:16S rRNA (cytosine967-C5)-methyltransferase
VQREQTLAALAVLRVFDGAQLRDALSAVDDHRGRGQSLVQELAYGTLRHFGTLVSIVVALARKPIPDPLLRALVTVALYQLDHTRAPPFAIVDRAVAAAAQAVRPAAKGLVNAMLRRYLRERDDIRARVLASDVARYSYPQWWIDRVRADHSDAWASILDAGNARPPLTLRVNVRVTTRDALVGRFEEAGLAAHAAGPAGIVVEPPRDVASLPGYAEGAFSVQDLAAQYAAPLLDVAPGMRVLDACAAPGGKATHLLEGVDAHVVAVDVDAKRLARIRDNLDRLRLADRDVALVEGDAGMPAAWWDGKPFDRVLLDVPCTASGVVRRHPDGKWRHRARDVARFAREQTRLLDSSWPLVAPGGKLLYATCSIFTEENEARIEAFGRAHADALRETLAFPDPVSHCGGQLLPSLPGARQNHDGFFYALLRRR